MAVTVDVVGTAASSGGSTVTTLTNDSITVNAGSNRAIIAVIGFDHLVATGITLNWDSLGTPQAFTNFLDASSTGTGGRVTIWGLVNPTAGNKRLAATWTNAADAALDGISLFGVNQTGGVTTFAHATSNTGTGVTATVTVTSAVGNYTIDVVADDIAALSAPTQTQYFNDGSWNDGSGAGSRAVGAATVAYQWTVGNAGAKWVDGAIDIVAAGGAAAPGFMWLH